MSFSMLSDSHSWFVFLIWTCQGCGYLAPWKLFYFHLRCNCWALRPLLVTVVQESKPSPNAIGGYQAQLVGAFPFDIVLCQVHLLSIVRTQPISIEPLEMSMCTDSPHCCEKGSFWARLVQQCLFEQCSAWKSWTLHCRLCTLSFESASLHTNCVNSTRYRP